MYYSTEQVSYDADRIVRPDERTDQQDAQPQIQQPSASTHDLRTHYNPGDHRSVVPAFNNLNEQDFVKKRVIRKE